MRAVMKMKAGDGFVKLADKAEPTPDAGEVKIKVESAGICGTDLKIRAGEAWSNPPVVLCHEFSGVVSEVGAGVNNFEVGDRVISETPQVVCNQCYYCKTNNFMMCSERLSIGYGVDGAFASHIVVRSGIVHKIPDSISFDEAALCEPLAVAVHAVYDAVKLTPTDVVLVSGPGCIGLLVAQVAKNFGCKVIITGISADAERLSIAKEIGIDYAVDVQEQDLKEFIDDLTNGMGADYVFECSGAQASIVSGIDILKRLGILVQVGLTKPDLEIPYALLPQQEKSIKGTFGHNWLSWDLALKLMMTGKVNTKKLVTHTFPLEKWEEAFDLADKKQGVKIIIHPNA